MLKSILLFLVPALFISCNQQTQKAASFEGSGASTCSSGAGQTQDGPLFTVDGTSVNYSQLPEDLKQIYFRIENEAYMKKQNILKEFALRVHLSKKQGKFSNLTNVPNLEAVMEMKEPTEAEIKKFYEENKDKLPPQATYEMMKPRLAEYLKGQDGAKNFMTQVEKLEKNGSLVINLVAPMAPELNIDTAKFPKTGNVNSKISVVEVSDYMCGHCQRAHPAVKEILKKYSNDISFTQINFSLNEQGMSGTYVRGAYCAQTLNNDTFWKYHHKAFEVASKPHDHSAPGHSHGEGNDQEAMDAIKEIASAIGFKFEEFEKCLNSDVAKKFVAETNAMLAGKGINSTPTFIVNNKKLEMGIQELETAIKNALGK